MLRIGRWEVRSILDNFENSSGKTLNSFRRRIINTRLGHHYRLIHLATINAGVLVEISRGKFEFILLPPPIAPFSQLTTAVAGH